MITLEINNQTSVKRLFQKKTLLQLAEKIIQGEGIEEAVEVSLLFCDDAFMEELNHQYRNLEATTDVLSFPQGTPPRPVERRMLGDIVISMDVVEERCKGRRDDMRKEICLLFCHGMLHLLGHDHENDKKRRIMQEKQAWYLGVPFDAGWLS
ncbi:MAG: rRNA maturation RNase YbeY [Candidatus Hydrogenedens sp.]|jgi:probable rRNA maturation factor|nr:rRNA maturation RNase YbeY [Candidatus Hydrogenedens sp.]